MTTEAPAAALRNKPRLPGALEALLFPDAGMVRAARTGRVRGALLFAMACALLWGSALAMRVDARDSTLRELDMQGKLATMSDRQIEDAQRSSERAFMVKKLAVALVEAPVELLASALALFALSWFLLGRSQGGPIFTAAAYGLLPSALANLIEAGATLLRGQISPEAGPLTPRTLAALAAAFDHPASGAAARLLGSIDLFGLWGALLLGFGLSAAASLPARRAVIGTLVGWLCYRLLRYVAMGG